MLIGLDIFGWCYSVFRVCSKRRCSSETLILWHWRCLFATHVWAIRLLNPLKGNRFNAAKGNTILRFICSELSFKKFEVYPQLLCKQFAIIKEPEINMKSMTTRVADATVGRIAVFAWEDRIRKRKYETQLQKSHMSFRCLTFFLCTNAVNCWEHFSFWFSYSVIFI